MGSHLSVGFCLAFLDTRRARRWGWPRRRVSEKARRLTRGMAVATYGDLVAGIAPKERLRGWIAAAGRGAAGGQSALGLGL